MSHRFGLPLAPRGQNRHHAHPAAGVPSGQQVRLNLIGPSPRARCQDGSETEPFSHQESRGRGHVTPNDEGVAAQLFQCRQDREAERGTVQTEGDATGMEVFVIAAELVDPSSQLASAHRTLFRDDRLISIVRL